MSTHSRNILQFAAAIILTSLACGLVGRSPERAEPGAASSAELIRQWASSATAGSEYGNPDWAAHQATGAPDTLGCGDLVTAWASADQFSVEWLEVRYDIPVLPFEVNIYETHTPSQVVRVELLDTGGEYHQVYSAEPKIKAECPYVLTVRVEEAGYQVDGVRVTVDQSQLGLPWDEIDAIELVGYGEPWTASGQAPAPEGDQPAAPQSPNAGGDPAAETTTGAWQAYSTADGLTSDEVHAIAVAGDGSVWFASGPFGKQSLSRLADGAIEHFDLGAADRPVSITHNGLDVAPDGSVWAATGTGLAYFDGRSWMTYTRQDGLLDDQTKSVALTSDGTLWAGSVKGASRYTGGSWTTYTVEDGLIDSFIEAIAVDDRGNPWFLSTFGGASYLDGKKWKSYPKGEDLPDYPPSCAAIGPDGAVWVGTGGGGVSQFDGRSWTAFSTGAGYDLEYVKAIIQAPDGAMWFGTEGNGVYRFDGTTWTNYRQADGLCYDWVDSIAVAPDGSLWFACRKHGIAHFTP